MKRWFAKAFKWEMLFKYPQLWKRSFKLEKKERKKPPNTMEMEVVLIPHVAYTLSI